jgi:hypothetical protein
MGAAGSSKPISKGDRDMTAAYFIIILAIIGIGVIAGIALTLWLMHYIFDYQGSITLSKYRYYREEL